MIFPDVPLPHLNNKLNIMNYAVKSLNDWVPTMDLEGLTPLTHKDFTHFYSKKYVFSNFYPCVIKMNGLVFSCSEHFYQWCHAS